ncbi:MAG TPA: QueT transporter family protein [Clostridia bacterium]|nr:QueT transporter family protein [Clostridia bacterium]
MVAAAYTVLTVLFLPMSYGPIQVRISEALTVLPYVAPFSIWGLGLGCMLANIFGGYGIYDIVFGSLATLGAGFLTRMMPSPYLAPVPPVIINALVVGAYLSILTDFPLVAAVLYVGLGEALACFGLGLPLLLFILRRQKILNFLR